MVRDAEAGGKTAGGTRPESETAPWSRTWPRPVKERYDSVRRGKDAQRSLRQRLVQSLRQRL
eukprot:1271678-Pleurochrysis_carterae.AAC.4